jgi:hypothetical protein
MDEASMLRVASESTVFSIWTTGQFPIGTAVTTMYTGKGYIIHKMF